MSVNLEIKGMLARLLATEDLVVEHKKVETACFNVHTRVLTLPMWERASNVVYDMLVAHEVSHALYTPDEDWTENTKVPPQFVNVVEDARVEKLIKRRYMGLAKTFYGAYKELQDDDFFLVGDDDVSTYNLADRVNLYYKVGNFLQVPFTAEEQEIVDMIGDAETFGDTLLAAEVLYRYCMDEQKQQQDIPQLGNHQQSSSQSASGDKQDQQELLPDESGDGEESADNKSNKMGENEKQGQKSESASGQEGGKDADLDVKTMSSLEESIKSLVSNNNSIRETTYLEIPELNLNSVIISNDEIHNKECASMWNNFASEEFVYVDKLYNDFKRSAQKEVNYLVKEFECRKSADSYARANTSRTGVLDTTKLHTYKHNEDLFKKVTTLATGKNHGLVFILDWSGSMGDVMIDTIKQLYNLIWFCRKVSIPFEVYAFTNHYNPVIRRDENDVVLPPTEHAVRKENQFVVDYSFGLMNIFTSQVRNAELEKQMKNIYRVVNYFGRGYYQCSYSIPPRMQLSGTPLNEALVTLHQILPKFQKENKLQKVQCVILTDGEAGPLNYYRETRRNYEQEPRLGTAYVDDKCYLRDRKTGNVYSCTSIHNNSYVNFTDLMLRNLRDKFPSVNFIGMRILETYGATGFIRQYAGEYGEEYTKAMNRWKKEKSFSLSSSGYHKYFGISGNALNKSTEFEVAECASKAQIKNAFTKSLGAKKMNKKILGEFMELIA
jgi:hypothetical protein